MEPALTTVGVGVGVVGSADGEHAAFEHTKTTACTANAKRARGSNIINNNNDNDDNNNNNGTKAAAVENAKATARTANAKSAHGSNGFANNDNNNNNGTNAATVVSARGVAKAMAYPRNHLDVHVEKAIAAFKASTLWASFVISVRGRGDLHPEVKKLPILLHIC